MSTKLQYCNDQTDQDIEVLEDKIFLEDYIKELPNFPESDFRWRYRMSSNLFAHIKNKLCNHDDCWHQSRDVVGVLGLFPEEKMRMLYECLHMAHVLINELRSQGWVNQLSYSV